MTLKRFPVERTYCREPKPGQAALWLLLLALVALGLALRASAEPAASLEPSSAAPAKPVFGLQQVGWRWVRYEASNFWVSVEARIQLYQQALEPGDRNWLQEPRPLTQPWSAPGPTGKALVLMSETRVASNREWRSEWLDPQTGSLLQRCRLGYGRSDSRIKCYGYGENAIYRERRESAMSVEDLASPEGWSAGGARSASRLTQDWRATAPAHIILPKSLPEDVALISWPLLLPAISAQPLRQPGDRVQLWVHTDFDIWRVRLEVTGTEETKVDYELAPESEDIKGRREALVVAISAEHLTGKPEDDFEFFGFSEPMAVLLDPDNRLPLVIRGNAPTFGPAKVRLHSAHLLP